jgi:pilus assembly protein CpaF
MDRLAARVAQGGVISIDEAFRQIAHHIHLIVHVNLIDDTWRGGVRTRRVSEVRRLTGGMEGNRPVTHLLYRAASETDPGVYHPEQEFLDQLAPYSHTWRAR